MGIFLFQVLHVYQLVHTIDTIDTIRTIDTIQPRRIPLTPNIRSHIIPVHLRNRQLILLILDIIKFIIRIIGKPNPFMNILASARRRSLDFRRARFSHALVESQRSLHTPRVEFFLEEETQSRGVLERGTGSLALIRHHGMCGISHDTRDALLPVGVRLVHPQSPRSDLLADGEMSENLLVEIRVRGEEFVGAGARVPILTTVVAFFSGEETVVGEETPAVAG